jgi:2-keto-4-pentenoate hydratase/2-oxohepta-3-ene-1,7-dioic acid hydratase in catechol pathway
MKAGVAIFNTPWGPEPRAVVSAGSGWYDVQTLFREWLVVRGTHPDVARGQAMVWGQPDWTAILSHGPDVLAQLQEAMAEAAGGRLDVQPVPHPTRWARPLRPSSLRDFLAFQVHAEAGARRRGEQLDPAWFQQPIYYKGIPAGVIGPQDPVPWPPFSQKLDFEAEIAAVVGRPAHQVARSKAREFIFGYTVMNDVSARDIQVAEMRVRLGPAQAKDFATVLGPYIVTPDELPPWNTWSVEIAINGEVWHQGPLTEPYWTFEDMIAYVSRAERLEPGDVFGSGTVPNGCGLDLERFVRPGDTVRIRIEPLGMVENCYGLASLGSARRGGKA